MENGGKNKSVAFIILFSVFHNITAFILFSSNKCRPGEHKILKKKKNPNLLNSSVYDRSYHSNHSK